MFFISWSGWGLLAVPLFFAGPLVVLLLMSMLPSDPARALPPWILGAGLLLSAGAIWVVGRWLHRGDGRVLIDEMTGQRIIVRQRHNFFWSQPLLRVSPMKFRIEKHLDRAEAV